MPHKYRTDHSTAASEQLRSSFMGLRRYRRPLWGAACLTMALALLIWAWSLPRSGPPSPPQPGLAALAIMGLILFFPWRGTLSVMSVLSRIFLSLAEGIHMLGDIARVPGLRALTHVHHPTGAAVLCLLGALFCFGAPNLRSIRRHRWWLRYTGVWPLIPTGKVVELSVGRDVQVSWKDSILTFPAEEASAVQVEMVDGRGWVGWWHTDRNTGLSYLLTFEVRSDVEAGQVAQALTLAGHRTAEAEWAEWRILALTVAVPPALLHDGGVYEAPIKPRLACPDCTAQKASNQECGFCHGARLVKERDTVSLSIPPESQPGKSLVMPGQGNRDANGISGPLVVTLRADRGRG